MVNGTIHGWLVMVVLHQPRRFAGSRSNQPHEENQSLIGSDARTVQRLSQLLQVKEADILRGAAEAVSVLSLK